MNALLDLVSEWRETAALLRDHGAIEAAQTTEKLASEVVEAVKRAEDEELTLAEAAAASGYAKRTIRQKIAEGKLENVGRKNAPRIRRGDLPKRTKSEKRTDFDATAEARSVMEAS